mmetsp:Transcript_24383/g.50688  ORF Transcript_24383/g.50688 Transcript_24383/m.50688 type:complete len:217 (-) Transcript_24383:411-1061(-)
MPQSNPIDILTLSCTVDCLFQNAAQKRLRRFRNESQGLVIFSHVFVEPRCGSNGLPRCGQFQYGRAWRGNIFSSGLELFPFSQAYLGPRGAGAQNVAFTPSWSRKSLAFGYFRWRWCLFPSVRSLGDPVTIQQMFLLFRKVDILWLLARDQSCGSPIFHIHGMIYKFHILTVLFYNGGWNGFRSRCRRDRSGGGYHWFREIDVCFRSGAGRGGSCC